MTNPEITPETRLADQLERVVRSATLATECSSAAIYLKSDLPEFDPPACFGSAAPSCSNGDYHSILERIAARGGDNLIVNDLLADTSGASRLALIAFESSGTRFVVLVAVRNEAGEPIGLLVVSDPRPRPGLSAAKTYLLSALASQIADSLAFQEMKFGASPSGTERLRLLESVVVHAKDSIVITEAEPFDLPGPRIVYCNAAFTEATGYSQDEVLGKTPRILQGVDTDPKSRAKIRAALEQWKPIEIEVLNYKKDGTPFWVELSIVPVADERGWYTHWVSVQRDVTERKAALEVETRARMAEASNESLQLLTNDLRMALDAAEAANIAKSQFLANMSHEIRTPLNGVLGMAQALWMDELTPGQRARLAIIRESGASLLAVLNDVLDISKIEAGRLEIELTEFDLQSLVAGVCGTFTEQANRNGVSFGLTIADDTNGIWRGDSVRLRQILYNLLSNALKFTSQGEVRVHMDLDAEGRLRVRIRDTGIGIPTDKIDALFSKFYQGDSSMTRRYGGTGLGLAICRQLCELMDGTIGVESRAGEGSTFTVSLPMHRVSIGANLSAGDAPSSAVAAFDPKGLSGTHLRVLVAEDNKANQLVMRALLQAFDVTPVVVDNGLLAVEAWEAERFDIVLMDVQMPVLDGVCATRQIRDREASTNRPSTPIIAVSANAMTHQVKEYLAAGMDGHIPKPLDIEQLAQILARFGTPVAGNDAGAASPTPFRTLHTIQR
jgi:PAS domain S-box-containing protein